MIRYVAYNADILNLSVSSQYKQHASSRNAGNIMYSLIIWLFRCIGLYNLRVSVRDLFVEQSSNDKKI